MPRKTVRARERLAQGNFTLPSPDEVQRIGPTGGFKSMQLAEWGVPWPPPAGWRHELRQRYEAQQRGEPLPPIPAAPAPPPKIGPRRPNGKADREQRRQDALDHQPQVSPPRLSVVVDMPQKMPRPSTLAVLAKIRALDDFNLIMLLTDIERCGLREAVQGFGLVPKTDVTSR